MTRNGPLCAALCSILLLLLTGCAVQQPAQSAELRILHSGELKLPKNSASPGRIYIDVVDSSKLAPGLADNLVRSLDNSRFRRVDSPSKAGYILTVTILAHARTSLPALEKAVNSGYGSKINLSGTETSAIIADVLLIQRRIPAHKRAEHQKMKNISSRNALATAKMRIAIELENQTEAEEADGLLAREIARAIRQ